MQTTGPMRKTKVAADVDPAWLNRRMIGIQACPVATPVAEMPFFVNEAILLLSRHLVVCQLVHDAVVESNRVSSFPVMPGKRFLKLTYSSLGPI